MDNINESLICHICNKRYKNLKALDKHNKLNHTIVDNIENTVKSIDNIDIDINKKSTIKKIYNNKKTDDNNETNDNKETDDNKEIDDYTDPVIKKLNNIIMNSRKFTDSPTINKDTKDSIKNTKDIIKNSKSNINGNTKVSIKNSKDSIKKTKDSIKKTKDSITKSEDNIKNSAININDINNMNNIDEIVANINKVLIESCKAIINNDDNDEDNNIDDDDMDETYFEIQRLVVKLQCKYCQALFKSEKRRDEHKTNVCERKINEALKIMFDYGIIDDEENKIKQNKTIK